MRPAPIVPPPPSSCAEQTAAQAWQTLTGWKMHDPDTLLERAVETLLKVRPSIRLPGTVMALAERACDDIRTARVTAAGMQEASDAYLKQLLFDVRVHLKTALDALEQHPGSTPHTVAAAAEVRQAHQRIDRKIRFDEDIPLDDEQYPQ